MTQTTLRLEDAVTLAGHACRVKGLLRLRNTDGVEATRYLLEGEHAAPQVVEERAGEFRLLRPFLPTAAPAPEGKELVVQDTRYVLGGVERLSVGAAEGVPIEPASRAPVLLSGRFEAQGDLILREFPPGEPGAQVFYMLKRVDAAEFLTEAQREAMRAAARESAAKQAAEAAESGEASGRTAGIVAVVVAILVVAILAFSCRSDEGAPAGDRSTPAQRR